MTWGTTVFSLGAGIGLVGHETIALVLSDDDAVRETLWTLIAADAPLDEILEGLSGHGLRTLPSFAIARIEGLRLVRVVVRGVASVVLETDDGPLVIESPSVKTWLEREVDGVDAVTLDSGGAVGGTTFHVLAGSVPAGRLTRSLVVDDPHALQANKGWGIGESSGTGDPVLDGSSADSTPEVSREADDVPVIADDADADQFDEVEQFDEPGADDLPVPDLAPVPAGPAIEDGAVEAEVVDDAGFPPPVVAARPFDSGATLLPADLEQIRLQTQPESDLAVADDQALAAPGQGDDAGYDFLFGHTVARSVQRAAVQPSVADEHEPTIEHGLIDSIPPSGSSPTSPAAPPTSQLGDHDGHTISRAELARMRAESAIVPSGPAVQARLCISGHPNPTHLSVCRSCGGPISPNPPVVVPRPVLGVLTFSNGLVVQVDRPQLIGRSPKVEGQVGGELPNLVKLDQAGQGVSRRHVAIHIENWQVLLEDLNSANGTIVALPGRPARRLVAGEPVALEQGTVVDLGGEMSISFEVSR
jgi:hypothetical protein